VHALVPGARRPLPHVGCAACVHLLLYLHVYLSSLSSPPTLCPPATKSLAKKIYMHTFIAHYINALYIYIVRLATCSRTSSRPKCNAFVTIAFDMPLPKPHVAPTKLNCIPAAKEGAAGPCSPRNFACRSSENPGNSKGRGKKKSKKNTSS
jgi:hypothetical protein